MRWLFFIACAAALAACPPPPPLPDAGHDAGSAVALEHCLDRPENLAQRPSGELPCELLPPGFRVER